jgi:hypothetical protein
MPKKKAAHPKPKPSKPPKAPTKAKAPGEGMQDGGDNAGATLDSGTEKILQMSIPAAETIAGNFTETQKAFLKDWELKAARIRAARQALRDVDDYGDMIPDIVRLAPSAWHLQNLVFQAINALKRGCREGSGVDASLADPHYSLARIAREFNVSLTKKSTPPWLLKLKSHPAFKEGFDLWRRRKGSHANTKEQTAVIERLEANGDQLRVEFGTSKVLYQWSRDGVIVRTRELDRIDSKWVVVNWLSQHLIDFDKAMDYPGAPLSADCAVRWSDEKGYLRCFLPYAKARWDEEGADSIQISEAGLLPLGSGVNGSRQRTDFGTRTDLKNMVCHQLRIWRDTISGPARKVSQK